MLIKKLFIILFLNVFIIFSLYSQDRTEIIRGVIFETGSGNKIANVKIYPDYQNDTTYSGSSGKFKIRISSHFRDNIFFEHPGYYPYLHRIKKGSNLFLQNIEMFTNSMAIDTIFYPSISTNRIIEGKVLAEDTRLPIINAAICLEDHNRIGYTNINGIFKLCIPNTTDKLIVTHKDYYSYFADVPGNKINNPAVILMEPLKPKILKDSCFKAKNSVRLVINKIFSGAVELDYERFLKQKHSVGLKSTFYLYKGIPYVEMILLTSYEMATFTGIKFSPYYRYYVWRNRSNGGFIEGKISYGYFDFEEINYFQVPYNDPDDAEYFSEISNSLGFGGSFGWMIHSTRSPVIINFSLGVQYFPLNVPKNKYIEEYGGYFRPYEVDDLFWYMFGPGSYLEFKFMIGGIF